MQLSFKAPDGEGSCVIVQAVQGVALLILRIPEGHVIGQGML